MSIPALIVIYVALLLGALCGMGIYSEMRRRRFGPTHSEDRIFRCQKCGYVYTDDADVDRSRCIAMRQTERADCVLARSGVMECWSNGTLSSADSKVCWTEI